MKKYFKYLLIILFVCFIVPQMALAAWWNPLSWSVWNIFKLQTTTVVAPAVQSTPETNTSVKTNIYNSQQNSQSNPASVNPTIVKKSNQPTPTPKLTTQPVSAVSSDIEGKIQYIVQIVCPNSGGTMSGTGIIMYGNSATDNKIITNKHVLNGATGPCGVYKTTDYKTPPTLYYSSSTTFIFSTNYDLAIITPNVSKLSVYPNTNVIFSDSADLLDKNINVLGYPVSAGNNITLTNGIISGTQNINNITMYKTDAKIDEGNSGGAVFDESGNFIGIPTLASQGSFSSYGYIIPDSVVKSFLDVVEQEGYGKQNWKDPDLTLYSVSPSNTVPPPPAPSSQNPAPSNTTPNQQGGSNLSIAQCQANAKVQEDACNQRTEQVVENTFSPLITQAQNAIRAAEIAQNNAMMAPEDPNLTDAQQEQLKTTSANIYQTEIDHDKSVLANDQALQQQGQEKADTACQQYYDQTYAACLSQ
jgi:S1-C subfamily serine protease